MRAVYLLSFLVLAGCSGPLSTLQPAGPISAEIARLWWVMLAGSFVITGLVVMLVLIAMGRARRTTARVWVQGMGLWFSVVILTLILGAGLWVGERILPRDDEATIVQAHAYQWGWRFTHTDAQGNSVESDDLLHISAGLPVDVLITSEDVIHSFWVPQLAGKMDAIPGRTNRARLIAAEPGTFAGLCAEFCGTGHAVMRFAVQTHAVWPPDLSEAP